MWQTGGIPFRVALRRRDGDRAADVFALIAADAALGRALHPSTLHLRAEVVAAAAYEGARSLGDIMVRRLRVALELPDGGDEVLEDVASLAAPILGWDVAEAAEQVAQYRADSQVGQLWKEGVDGDDRT